ncbi:MAG: PASTA domain-containing protein [Flavobacteriales bacterium]|nr:PASTA domain-containing protein [Flavobacteriales bacterium]
MAAKRTFAPFLLPLVIMALALFGGWRWLKSYTLHDHHVRVPDLKGLSTAEASDLLEQRGLVLEVIDSVHNDDARKGTVVIQDPDGGREVKPGRRIYVTMNATQPKMLNMPSLVNLSKRQAISTLEILGLKVKEMRYRPDPCTDCVLEQLYREQPITPDARIRRGETIVLVLGSGDSGQLVPVPDLVGLTHAELKLVLNMASLNLGLVVLCEGCNTTADSALARVSRQSPVARAHEVMPLGGAVDVWLTMDTLTLSRPAQPEESTP